MSGYTITQQRFHRDIPPQPVYFATAEQEKEAVAVTYRWHLVTREAPFTPGSVVMTTCTRDCDGAVLLSLEHHH